jgi:hypothetical protein
VAGFKAGIAGLKTPGQQVDLGGFAYSSAETVAWSQSGTSGTLTVTDGAQTAHLTLVGAYVKSDFHLATDGHGGTYLDDPPTTTSGWRNATGFVQAMAGLGGRGASPGLTPIDSSASGPIGAPTLTPTESSGR